MAHKTEKSLRTAAIKPIADDELSAVAGGSKATPKSKGSAGGAQPFEISDFSFGVNMPVTMS